MGVHPLHTLDGLGRETNSGLMVFKNEATLSMRTRVICLIFAPGLGPVQVPRRLDK